MKSTTKITEEKIAMIRRWESSGMSQNLFCKQEAITFHYFYYWLKKYRKQDNFPAQKGKFIKLSMPDKILVGNIYAEVNFKNGTSIRFHQPVNVSDLKQLFI